MSRVPWRELCALVEPLYPKAGNGRPPVGVRMLRIYFLQQWFNLSDRALEEALESDVVGVVFPTASEAVEIPKAKGGTRRLGIPTVSVELHRP